MPMDDFPDLGAIAHLKPGSINLDNQEATFHTIEQAILGLWEVINGLTSLEPPKQERYRVTIFGSARIRQGSPVYNGVRQLAEELTKMGCDIITGGGPGLMQAANEGSVEADPNDLTQSIGIRLHMDFEQETNPFVEKVYMHRTFFTRLHHFVLISDAFIVTPGGIGTSLETFMIWQLLQVRKMHNKPLILVGKMWAELVEWAKASMVDVEPQLASPEDMMIPHCVDSFDDAIAVLKVAHAQWRS